jgi:hypothetical protein
MIAHLKILWKNLSFQASKEIPIDQIERINIYSDGYQHSIIAFRKGAVAQI